jgi:hypothetical protein
MATLELEEMKDAEELRRLIMERRRAGGVPVELLTPEPPPVEPGSDERPPSR